MERFRLANPEEPLPRPDALGSPGSTSSRVAAELRELIGLNHGGADVRGVDGLEFAAWAKTIATAKQQIFDYERFPYQREIFDVFGDDSVREAVLMKGVQVGASELMVRQLIYFACSRPLTVMYVFPAEKQLEDFRNTRIRPLIDANPRLKARLGHVDNSGLIRFGASSCYLRAARSKNNVISVDADVLLFDEYDELDQKNVAEAERRIAASPLALIRRVGVPTEPGYGIAKLYEDSDQRRWHVPCIDCGKVQVPGFDENVRWEENAGRIVDPRIVCSGCGRALDVRRGEWLASYPRHAMPGFQVSRLMVPGVDLTRLIEASKRSQAYQRAAFFRSDLGLPYAEESAGLDRSAVAAAVSAGNTWNHGVPLRMPLAYSGPNFVTAGVDVASTRAFNVRISEQLDPLHASRARRRGLFIGAVQTPDEVVSLLRRYGVHCACIDALPEQRIARLIADQLPGQVYLVLHTAQHEPLKVDSNKRMVTVNRTYLLDTTVADFYAQTNLLPEDLPEGYIEHMTAPRRIVVRRDHRPHARWESRGPDDYFHAEAYDLAAAWVAVYRTLEASQEQVESTLLSEVIEYEPSHVVYHPLSADSDLMTPSGYNPVDDAHGFYDDGIL